MKIHFATTVAIGVLATTACKGSPSEKPDEPTTQPTSTATNGDTEAQTKTNGAPATNVGTNGDAGEPPDGKELYGRICATCHGKTGDGKGLEQELFSFGAPEERWKNGATVDGIIRTMSQGVHATSMKPFPQYGPAEKKAIAGYVLELRTDLVEPEDGSSE